ncbi:MAG: type I secretion system permease/ATPase [Hyphomicrobiales bacterium]
MSKPPHAGVPETRLKAAFATCRGAFASAGVFSFFINMLMLTGPLFMLQVYDRVLTSGSIPTLVALLILVAVLFAFMGALELIRSRLLVRIARRVDEELSDETLSAVFIHALRHSPNVNSQPVRDLDALRQFVGGPGPFTLFDAPWTPVYLGVIFLLHWWLGVFAVIGALILFAVAAFNEIVTREPMTRSAQASMASHALVEEGRRNSEVLKAMGMTRQFRAKWQRLHGTALDQQIQASDRAGEITSFSKATRLFLQSAMLALGAYLAVQQLITPGTMIAASIIMSRALQPLEQAITHWRSFLQARKAYDRLGGALETAQEAVPTMQLPPPRGHLHVEQLFVRAPGSTEIILHGLNFELQPGTALGVIGVTGAGKTSLVRALVGLWPAAKGTVRIDDATLDQWSPEALGPYVGYLPQDVELFSGTIAENIARLEAEPDSEAVVTAAQRANVHEMILRLADGYDTLVGEGGFALSAGQRQRIGLARALYGDPIFVVLDEPNSNLDAEGEAALVAAIHQLKNNGCTVVVAAHRPSAIGAVDQLLFLKDGKMAAFGPRDEVLAAVTQSVPGRVAEATPRRDHGGA